MLIDKSSIEQIAGDYDLRDPWHILRCALDSFDNIAISFSGAEDVVLIDMAHKIRPSVPVFSLDTGRLHPETLQFLEKVRTRYKITIECLNPDAEAVEALVKQKGLFSFYEEGHGECCGIRKVAPLRRKLAGLDAWVTGQRKDQSPGTRSNIAVAERDKAFSPADGDLFKFNPLANWSSAQVWAYIRENKVPYNELHERGFVSIGCEPCTRSILPGEHERVGRWWWEEQTAKECGLHIGNMKASS